MNKVIIFGGTTEGRELASDLAKAGIGSVYMVATDYGKMVVDESPFIDVHIGRLDSAGMQLLFNSEEPVAIVDATHPYAEIVSGEIDKAIKEVPNVPFYRLGREQELVDDDNCYFFDTAEECARALENTEGTVFVTTGSKNLSDFCSIQSLKERLIVRVIPNRESLDICYENGLKGNQIIAMQGPFSRDMNLAFFRDTQAKAVVLKESGKIGGERERILAARAVGADCYIIKRPDNEKEGFSYQEIREKLYRLCGCEDICNEQDTVRGSDVKTKVSVTLAGFGMGYGSMTREVLDAIEQADYVFGAPRMIKSLGGDSIKYPYYLAKDIVPALERICQESEKALINVVILFSGDTGFYSGTTRLYEALKDKDYIIKTLPGISSVSALCAKANTSWQDAKIMSTHGVAEEDWFSEIITGVTINKKLICITSGLSDVQKIGTLLMELEEAGKGKYQVIAGRNLYEDEQLSFLSPMQCNRLTEEGLYTLLIVNERPENKRLVPGLSDEVFIRDKVPMTKEEIRALSICKLGVTANSVAMDIGSGTGSIAVELGLLDPSVSVYAIEKKPEAVELIKKNLRKNNLKNVKVIEKEAPEALNGLPAPDVAFIGGTSGNMEEILDTLRAYHKPVKVVLNAVTLETIAEINSLLTKYEIEEPDIVQVQVSKVKKAGKYSMLQGQNPVFIVSFSL